MSEDLQLFSCVVSIGKCALARTHMTNLHFTFQVNILFGMALLVLAIDCHDSSHPGHYDVVHCEKGQRGLLLAIAAVCRLASSTAYLVVANRTVISRTFESSCLHTFNHSETKPTPRPTPARTREFRHAQHFIFHKLRGARGCFHSHTLKHTQVINRTLNIRAAAQACTMVRLNPHWRGWQVVAEPDVTPLTELALNNVGETQEGGADDDTHPEPFCHHSTSTPRPQQLNRYDLSVLNSVADAGWPDRPLSNYSRGLTQSKCVRS